MRDLIATKAGRYGTRRLLPDDDFQARPRDARLLVAIGKARYATPEDAKTVPKIEPPKIEPRYVPVDPRRDTNNDTHRPADDLSALRAAYERKTGKRPFMGWNADTLREKIAGKAD